MRIRKKWKCAGCEKEERRKEKQILLVLCSRVRGAEAQASLIWTGKAQVECYREAFIAKKKSSLLTCSKLTFYWEKQEK